MSLTLTVPPDFNPVRNPNNVAMATPGPVITPGATPEWYIDIIGGVTLANAGQTFTIEFLSTTVVFTEASTPDPLLGEYGGATIADVGDSLELALLANYYIATNFIVTRVVSSQIQLLARESGTAHGLTSSTITLNTPGVLTTFAGAGGFLGADEVNQVNYGALLQLWVEDEFLSDEYELKLEEVYPVDDAGEASADISRALRAYLPEPYTPAPDLVHPARMVGSFKRFTIKAAERYGDPVETFGLVRAEGLFAYLAGRSEVARTNDPDWEDQLLDGDGYQRFLTNWPNLARNTCKRVSVDQCEFLSMVVVEDTLHLRLKADVYFTDYTMQTMANLDTYLGEDDVVRGEVVIFPVGVGQQGIEDMAPTKTIDFYCVYVTDNANTRLTERRWFTVDREHRHHYRQFHYLNTLGGIDTLAVFGQRAEEVVVGMERTNRYVPLLPSGITDARDNTDVLNTVTVNFDVGSEHLHQDELEALRDLVASERIVERVGAEHWPVQVLDSKMKLGDEADHKGPVRLKYRYALRNTANTLQQ